VVCSEMAPVYTFASQTLGSVGMMRKERIGLSGLANCRKASCARTHLFANVNETRTQYLCRPTRWCSAVLPARIRCCFLDLG
jgi:hypothetical protein